MSMNKKSRREFLSQIAGTVAAGGAAAFLPQLGLIGNALAQAPRGSVPGYRALVCVYFAGGNDSWNLLMPGDVARHAVYATARGGIYNTSTNTGALGITRAGQAPAANDHPAALPINDSATAQAYGLHPACSEMQALYNANRMAFLPNVGTLKRPITKAEYNANSSLRPPQLYSHSDQENQWQYGQAGNRATGWGGLVADRVRAGNSYQALSPCISVAGSNRFQIGDPTVPYQMGTGGVANLSGLCNPPLSGCTGFNSQRTGAMDQLLAQSYDNVYAGEYARIMRRARDLQEVVKLGLDGPNGAITTVFPAGNSLGDQLRMVARMIKISRETALGIQHVRQIYFVRTGGFDLHDGMMVATNPTTFNTGAGHYVLMRRLSQALNAFWTALGEIGAQNEVTTFSMSEFARTLNSNGNGSDHAWGGIQFAMGGAVQGGRLYGAWPDQTLNGPVSFSRGQTIPSTGVEQMGATLARWMGVTASTELNAVFPNLVNFPSSDLGFMI